MESHFAALTLPHHPHPRVSVVICAFGQINMTYHCLYSIALAADPVDIEVIVVNDASPDNTAAVLWGVEGIRLINNEENLGYLRSANIGVAAAHGEFVMFLNNDTAVRPGWLSSLLERADSDPAIGAVGSMLLNPDGSVQEAGSILWDDATAWNYGQGDSPDDERFDVARDVDYCSAAALLVRAPFLHERGGYDERYAPAFYEDTDLCLALHEAGRRVVFEPASVVTHVGGASMGTDPAKGLKAGQERNRLIFAEKWEAELRLQTSMDPRFIETSRDFRPRAILLCDVHLPDVTRDSGSVRLMAIIEGLVEAGWRVHFWHMDKINTESAVAALTALGVQLLDQNKPADDQIRALTPHLELCWVSRPTVASTVLTQLAHLVPDAAIIYDTVDLHFVREQRRLALLPDDREERTQRVAKEFELAAIRAADLTIAISEDEADIIAREAPDARVLTLGNIHLVPEEVPGLEGRSGLIFVGGWEHVPNVEAAHVLAEEIMPRLRPRAPGVRLQLVGSHVNDIIRAMAAQDLDVVGWVPDVAPLLDRARVFCAPLFWGAGVKGKVGQALAHGLPVVTTSIGAEGMHLEHGTNVLIADTVEGLVAETARLLTDDDLWHALSRNGREHVAALFSPATAARTLQGVLALAAAG